MTQDQEAPTSMYCRKCGYQLAGLSENRCPECGRPFDPADRRTFYSHARSYARRWWGKRIGPLLAIVVLPPVIAVAVASAWTYRQYHADWVAEQQASAILKGQARKVVLRSNQIGWYGPPLVWRLSMMPEPLRDRVMSVEMEGPPRPGFDPTLVCRFKQCGTLELTNMGITDDQLRLFQDLPYLKRLLLDRNAAITDAGLVHVASLYWLAHLDVRGTAISRAGLRQLRRIPRLYVLRLSDIGIRDEDLAELRAFEYLRTLQLEGRSFTDAGLPHLKGMLLPSLGLAGTGITDGGLAALAGIEVLETLDLSGTAVTDAGLDHLAALARLTHLDLSGTAVTDAGLQKLKVLPRLSEVNVDAPNVTHEGVQQLRMAIPTLRVDGP